MLTCPQQTKKGKKQESNKGEGKWRGLEHAPTKVGRTHGILHGAAAAKNGVAARAAHVDGVVLPTHQGSTQTFCSIFHAQQT